MKTKIKSTSKEKNIDLLISGLSGMEILDINEMICIRGGDAIPTVPPSPPIIIPPQNP